jgi:hypothetical protein
MNATAAVADVSRPFPQDCDSLALLGQAALQKLDRNQHAVEVKRALKRAGLTVVDVSVQTKMRFGERTPYFIPQTFLYKQNTGVTPHICQVAALSEITGFHFSDWLDLWGFDFRLILTLQLKISNQRTTVVTPFPERFPRELFCNHMNQSGRRRLQDRYFYVKIGSRDAVVYPDVKPGSIVRVDRLYSRHLLNNSSVDSYLWLVEHPNGLTCCRVKFVGDGEIVLLPNRPPLAPWPLRLSTQARILGLVDSASQCREVSDLDAMHGRCQPEQFAMLSNSNRRLTVSRLLRKSRSRTGISLREAHSMTLQIAHLLQNRDFRIATSLLSDYEAMDRLPRHIPKIISLCVVYGINPWELLVAGGVHIDDAGRRSLYGRAEPPATEPQAGIERQQRSIQWESGTGLEHSFDSSLGSGPAVFARKLPPHKVSRASN